MGMINATSFGRDIWPTKSVLKCYRWHSGPELHNLIDDRAQLVNLSTIRGVHRGNRGDVLERQNQDMPGPERRNIGDYDKPMVIKDPFRSELLRAEELTKWYRWAPGQDIAKYAPRRY